MAKKQNRGKADAGAGSAQQAARAAELRKEIAGGWSSGVPRKRPPTPREMTDEAARRAWEAAKAGRRR